MRKTTQIAIAFIAFVGTTQFAQAIIIPAGENPAFNNLVRSYLAQAKQKSPYLNDLIRAVETTPSVIYIFPITDDQKTWHSSGDQTRSHTDARDGKSRGAARSTATDSYVYINPDRVDPNNRTFGRGTLVHELVHALDLAKGQYNTDYMVREKRAVFFENIWRESHGHSLRDSYSGRFPTQEYQSKKASGRIAQFVDYYYRKNDIP